MLFGCCLRQLREQKGLTRSQLAPIVAMQRTHLGEVESGKRPPLSANRICLLLAHFNLNTPAEISRWKLLAQWDRMMRRLPAQAFHARRPLRLMGEMFAAGRMTSDVCDAVERVLRGDGSSSPE